VWVNVWRICNCYIAICYAWWIHFFQQTVIIPMGTNCVPILVDFYLYSFETNFIQGLLKKWKETHIPEDLITISYSGCTCSSFSSFVSILSLSRCQKLTIDYHTLNVCMVFDATFNNISVILWR
jgi:hypothetical protein